jgi:hypothetical protein
MLQVAGGILIAFAVIMLLCLSVPVISLLRRLAKTEVTTEPRVYHPLPPLTERKRD